MKLRIVRVALLWIFVVSLAGGLLAQRPAPGLQDLVGARGRDGEAEMEKRGYSWVHTEKTEVSADSYWRDNRSGQCIRIRTTEGRYEFLEYTPEPACQRGEQIDSEAGYDRTDEFATVCGVAFGGKIYQEKKSCKVVDYYTGDVKKRTDLHFSDQVMRLRWQNEKMVAVHIEGLETQRAEYRTAEGDTNFFMLDKTYFYTSDKEAAKLAVESLKE